MKCSKCGYLGFETSDRCRNCGYEFSLSHEYELPDLSLKRDEGPVLDDFSLVDAAMTERVGAPAAVMEAPRVSTRRTPSSMPLLDLDDDTPLITKPSPPRAPLAVRRSTPDIARLRMTPPKAPSLEGLELSEVHLPDGPRAPADRAHVPAPTPGALYQDAGVGRRLLAAAVDSAILLAIDLIVIYFTMQICGVGIDEFNLLPKGPLIAFLVVQNVGYLVAFTAGGQTLGKMAAAIKIVTEDGGETLDVGCALKRTVMWLLLAVPAGLGLLSAFFDHDHRGLHDRFAGTRVVRAAA
ncbi:MAG TPA: RDD family protein [Vicinamibacterales bacterium]|nr:RDD family protein [Vicinamibacterales bacterium]